LGVDCWGQGSDECATGDGFGNRQQMAAGVVSSPNLGRHTTAFTFSPLKRRFQFYKFIPFQLLLCSYKGIRKVVLPTSSHSHWSQISQLLGICYFI
jgi:hypothetical protein